MLSELTTVLSGFSTSTECGASVWVQPEESLPPRLEAVAADGVVEWTPPRGNGQPERLEVDGRVTLRAAVPGPRRAWLVVGPSRDPAAPLEKYLALLLPIVAQHLQSALEVEHAANELAERYEEINLLYTITEILGRSLALEETAATILREITETVGARRGAVFVHDRVTDTLQAAAAIGVPVLDIPPIAVDDPCSVSATVFRDQRARMVEAREIVCEAESFIHRGMVLAVPILWTGPDGQPEQLGVLDLSDRASRQPFSAGDQKLIAAIASQIGTAIKNARLVRESLRRERLAHEMELAQEMQLKLLPRTSIVEPDAIAAARVVPAESVGGDFYNLFRLGEGRAGVMIADVSGHGYRAALMMALAMSASAIHAQRARDPGEMLAQLLGTLREELASTEMFISAFYGVIDRGRGTLSYSNAGHPHAFLVAPDGGAERLRSTDPPLGMVDEPPTAVTRPWRADGDLLLLFTDGVSDARDRFGERFGETAVLDIVARHRDEPPQRILEELFTALDAHTGETIQRDDETCLVLRS
jgi:sigma-B regulation protein RsbU (phosphoserine phosphatase)